MRVIRCITVIGVVLALNLAPVESPSEPAPDPVAAFDSFVSDGGLILPKKLYATAGTEFEVFWCAIVDERDPKIFSYEVHCDCSFVSQRGRGFVIAPGEFAHGRYKLTVTVVVKASDSSTKRKQDFSTTLIVAPSNSGSDQRLKMLLVGDSLGHESRFPDQLAMLFKKPRNPQMEFLGSHRWPRMLKVNPYTYVDPLTAEFEDAHEQDDFCIKHTGDPRPEESRVCHEHYGGWTFARFYEFGAVSVYTDCTSARVCHANNSPFVFGYTGNMPNVNVRKYLNETLHLTHDDQMPDYVHIQLGINDATYGRENPDDVEQMHQKQAEIIQNAETLIGHIRAALPNAVITIGSIIQGAMLWRVLTLRAMGHMLNGIGGKFSSPLRGS